MICFAASGHRTDLLCLDSVERVVCGTRQSPQRLLHGLAEVRQTTVQTRKDRRHLNEWGEQIQKEGTNQ